MDIATAVVVDEGGGYRKEASESSLVGGEGEKNEWELLVFLIEL